MYCNQVSCRIISAHVLSVRQQTSSRSVANVRRDSSIHSHMELDFHADTIILGKNCVVLAFTGRECDVSPYTESFDAIKNVPIVSGATAWVCQSTGETLILVFS